MKNKIVFLSLISFVALSCQKKNFTSSDATNASQGQPPTSTDPSAPVPPSTPQPPTAPTPTPVSQDLTVTGRGMADVLFVVNDSPSMWWTLRYDIPYRFSEFLPQMNGVDYRIAVTSAQTRGISEYQGGRITRVLYRPVPFAGLVLVPYQYVITPNMKNAGQNFLATIMRPEVICTQVAGACPQGGDSYQEAIHSSIMALNNPTSVAKLLRPDAPLNIVIISDDDEGNGNLTDRHGKIKDSAPSYNRPQTLIDLVQAKWPGKQFRAHAVTTTPDEEFCNNANQYGSGAGYLYNDLVKKTGGAIASICDNDETKSIKKIANSLVTGPVSFTLQCAPKNVQATYSPQPTVPTQALVTGNHVTFAPTLPTNTKVHLTYSCP